MSVRLPIPLLRGRSKGGKGSFIGDLLSELGLGAKVYPFSSFLQRLKLWVSITVMEVEKQGAAITARLQGVAYKIALKTTVYIQE